MFYGNHTLGCLQQEPQERSTTCCVTQTSLRNTSAPGRVADHLVHVHFYVAPWIRDLMFIKDLDLASLK
jgi:hypothetical protein